MYKITLGFVCFFNRREYFGLNLRPHNALSYTTKLTHLHHGKIQMCWGGKDASIAYFD